MTLIRPGHSHPTPVSVTIYASPIVEGLMALWAHAAEGDSLDSFEFQDEIADLVATTELDADELAWMDRNDGMRWSVLVPFAASAEARSFDELADHLESLSPQVVVEALLDYADHDCPTEECDHGVLEVEAPKVEVAKIIVAIRSLAGSFVDRISSMAAQTDHERQLTAFLARRLSSEALIESVTRGIAYRFTADVTQAVLVPSRIMRPWNLIVHLGSIYYFIYPMSDEAVEAEPDAPPAWMVDTYKAVGDVRRLRLLRRLAQGPATLGELADVVDLAKSTTHHHVRLLRAAGLVRAEVVTGAKDASTYELRPDAIADAHDFLIDYLELSRST